MREDDDAPDVYSLCSHFVGAKITSFVQLVCDIAGVICAAWEAGEEFGVPYERHSGVARMGSYRGTLSINAAVGMCTKPATPESHFRHYFFSSLITLTVDGTLHSQDAGLGPVGTSL